jgi:hypothetical protein
MDNRKDKGQCCVNCYYARLFSEHKKPIDDTVTMDLPEYVATSAVCHRYPPTLINTSDGSYTDFPSPNTEDWCGEYRSKE